MILRDALTGPEDLSTIASLVRWESLKRREVSTPDRLLERWRASVSSLARQTAGGFDEGSAWWIRPSTPTTWTPAGASALCRGALVVRPGAAARAHRARRRDVSRLHRAPRDSVALASDASPAAGGTTGCRPACRIRRPGRFGRSRRRGTSPAATRAGCALSATVGARRTPVRPARDDRPGACALGRLVRAHQAKAIARSRPGSGGWWVDQHKRVQVEQRRRAEDGDRGGD